MILIVSCSPFGALSFVIVLPPGGGTKRMDYAYARACGVRLNKNDSLIVSCGPLGASRFVIALPPGGDTM